MEHCLLIADSGSSKTDWIYLSDDNGTLEIHTAGINPVRDSRCAISLVLREQLLPALPNLERVKSIYFYGAGCIRPYSSAVADALASEFPHAGLHVESDLLGAARALCGHEAGIACILGTGSNSCLYDGTAIVAHTPPLGYVLGDEGSGAVLGRTFLSDLYKGLLPVSWVKEFEEEYHLSMAQVIDHVYRQPQPNRFLASLVPFVARRASHPLVHDMLLGHFRTFLRRNVVAYGHRHLAVHCVGGIAHQFAGEFREVLAAEGFVAGKILLRPITSLASYHSDFI
ncbi:MAG: ATPase [Bacteroidaceae bacterium]